MLEISGVPEGMRFCIDENCPDCDWAERWFDPNRGVFGCSNCDYESEQRDA